MNGGADALVSIVISVYNGERHLAETIESVINQSYPGIEVIIVDDGSTDGSGEIAQQYVPRVRYHYQSNRGIADAWNKGVAIARGDYFAFNGADDLWTQNKVQLELEAFSRSSALDIVFGHVKQFYSPELTNAEREKIRCPDELMAGISAGTMLVRRESFYRAGTFDNRWRRGIFNDWYLRAIELGLKTCVIPELVMWRRLHRTNHGIVNRDKSIDYVRMLKASLDRRRA
jgi:glycosyltransferase involved in cell wall biosynthesis